MFYTNWESKIGAWHRFSWHLAPFLIGAWHRFWHRFYVPKFLLLNMIKHFVFQVINGILDSHFLNLYVWFLVYYNEVQE